MMPRTVGGTLACLCLSAVLLAMLVVWLADAGQARYDRIRGAECARVLAVAPTKADTFHVVAQCNGVRP